ncbi:MAG: chemotaxis response regulator protein-glutamate methylesterase [Alphaproteobacteria bacterium]
MPPIKVLIVDDSVFIRKLLTEILQADPALQVVGAANDPIEAKEMMNALNPDVLTLDVEMPHMDGVSFLEKIMWLKPMPVVMISSKTTESADVTLRSLALGAVDFITKPSNFAFKEIENMADVIREKVKNAAKANLNIQRNKAPTRTVSPIKFKQDIIVAIGSSTGGVEALEAIFKNLPVTMPPILVTQHMPPHFTESLAKRLNALLPLTVVEAKDGERLQPNHVYIAPGGRHLVVKKTKHDTIAVLLDTEKVNSHRPSVDVMFQSVAETFGPKAIGIILTGMGTDGAMGLKAMRDKGAQTLGQNQATCVIYGMPKAAMAAGGVCQELPLNDLAPKIMKFCEAGS